MNNIKLPIKDANKILTLDNEGKIVNSTISVENIADKTYVDEKIQAIQDQISNVETTVDNILGNTDTTASSNIQN